MGLHTNVPAQPTPKQAERFVTWMLKLNASGKGRAWAICAGDEVAGAFRFNKIDTRGSIASIGYEVAQPLWGQGYASAAVGAAAAYGHGGLGLRRLEAWVLGGNPASGRVLERAGFTHEGTQREKMLLHKTPRGVWLYARLAADPMPQTRRS